MVIKSRKVRQCRNSSNVVYLIGRDANDTNYLGFTFQYGKIRWSEESERSFRHRVKELTGRSWLVSMPCRIRKLSVYIRGWVNYFGISEYYHPIHDLDSWIRRRVRMCYIKAWRKRRTRIRNLQARGVLRCCLKTEPLFCSRRRRSGFSRNRG
jgi:hypothetical protein